VGKSSEEQAPAFTRLETLTAVIVVGVLALALGLVGLAMPTAKAQTKKVPYTQSGTFGYSAEATKTSPYGADGLSSGEPILLDKVGPVTATFRYKLASKAPATVRGTAAMQAKVELSQGLTRQFPVATTTSFEGTEVMVSGRLPLKAIKSYVDSAQAAFQDTGFSSATITLQPTIKVRGTIGSHPLKATYSPKLPFSLNGTTLVVGQSSGDPTAQSATNPLKPSKQGKLGYRTTVPNTVPLLVVHPTVTLARELGFGLAGLCLVLALLLARPLLRSGEANEPSRIRTLYGAHLIEVRELELRDGPVADVASMDSLADLAKKYESMIMHVRRDGDDSYLVWDNGMLYRYRPVRPAAPSDETEHQNGALLTKTSTKKLNGMARN